METAASALLLIAFVILALAPTIAAFAISSGRRVLGFISTGTWVILGVYSYMSSTTPASGQWDIFFALFWLSCGMAIVMSLVSAILKERKEIEPELDDYFPEDRELIEDIDEQERDRERFDRIFRGSGKRRKKSNQLSVWAKTGEERRR